MADKDKNKDKTQKVEVDPMERLEAESHQLAMIASTFANDELQLKKQTLQQYVVLTEDLKGENVKLREELKEQERESLQVVEFLRKEVERKQEQIESLTKQLDTQKQDLTKQMEDEKATMQATIDEKDAAFAELKEQKETLETQLASVDQFKKDKYDMEVELKRLRDNECAIKEKNERELSKLKYQSLEEKVRLKNEEIAMEQRFNQDVERKAYELLDEKMKRIHQQNKHLLEDKGLLEKELEQLLEIKKRVEEDKKCKQRDLELKEQSLEQFALQGHRQSKEVRELMMKNRHLASSLQNTINNYELEKTNSKKQYDEILKAREQQLVDAHQMVQIRTQELHRIRSLAKHIISSRSELEAFFNEALEYVKQQIAIEGPDAKSITERTASGRIVGPADKTQKAPHPPARIQAPAGRPDAVDIPDASAGQLQPYVGDGSDLVGFEPLQEGSTSGSPRENALPPIANRSDMGRSVQSRRIPVERVDISDLSWEDKERVLRILFAKINNVQAKKTRRKQVQDVGSTTFVTQI
jgi:hypothetical protein|mmetsp:Transcript_60837/g.100601  ORF Transcript_60837/g.100601 Transcript_60837/m.100601 type:complete len:528 (+) Transcript_60837:1-1584(+)|eukprot:CAMPEP_0174321370 /NCGR_PEP_ID=MMETSP0810-20121108/10239_1 /TAXON_ID=73025 ORGANISM="Eutreptiella gymnastica-like, Strain CCMP1594" /NCGR_SAMPLE_ID=MMETSP0810 /ASSEMBLY_ACC=CAM_ASM_000659 /LENGTH=527 /DNA_ID=CAMNT_0015432729 /DNA_START=64 /DNA_END=1647 /DNA_ORIENTATION=+